MPEGKRRPRSAPTRRSTRFLRRAFGRGFASIRLPSAEDLADGRWHCRGGSGAKKRANCRLADSRLATTLPTRGSRFPDAPTLIGLPRAFVVLERRRVDPETTMLAFAPPKAKMARANAGGIAYAFLAFLRGGRFASFTPRATTRSICGPARRIRRVI